MLLFLKKYISTINILIQRIHFVIQYFQIHFSSYYIFDRFFFAEFISVFISYFQDLIYYITRHSKVKLYCIKNLLFQILVILFLFDFIAYNNISFSFLFFFFCISYRDMTVDVYLSYFYNF